MTMLKNLDPKIAVPVLILLICGGLFLALRSTGVIGGESVDYNKLPALPTASTVNSTNNAKAP